MAIGIFRKIGDFFKKAWKGAKKWVPKVLQYVPKIVKPVWDVVKAPLSTVIPGGAVATTAIDTGLSIAEKLGQGNVQEAGKEFISKTSPYIKFNKSV